MNQSDRGVGDQRECDKNEVVSPGQAVRGSLPQVRPGELRSVVWATAWFFFVLLSYSIVRPLRETMGAIAGTKQLQNMMLVTFFAMLLVVPLYATLVARLPRRWVVRVVFHFFCASLIAFAVLMRIRVAYVQLVAAHSFFIWVNVFALFATSVFWSVMADLFSSEQGKRLFGAIAAGGTAGAIAGAFLTSQLASRLGIEMLLVVSAVMIQAGLWCAWRLEKQAMKRGAQLSRQELQEDSQSVAEGKPTGGGLMVGISSVANSPYLALICVFLFFVQAFGSQMYFQQAEIIGAEIPDKAEKTQMFAYIDLGTQLLTLALQTFVSATVLRRFGTSIALVILPLVYFSSFFALSISGTLPVLIVAMVAVRGTAYGLTVPAREVLFTVVKREDKYKSKNFIDTVVLRGGDALSAQIFGTLRNYVGIGLTALNVVALPVTILWALIAFRLGRKQGSRARSQDWRT